MWNMHWFLFSFSISWCFDIANVLFWMLWCTNCSNSLALYAVLRTLLFSTTEEPKKKCTNGKGQQKGIGNIQRNHCTKTLCKDTGNEIILLSCWWKSIKANYAAIMELPRGHFQRYVSPTLVYFIWHNQIEYVIIRINHKLLPVQYR